MQPYRAIQSVGINLIHHGGVLPHPINIPKDIKLSTCESSTTRRLIKISESGYSRIALLFSSRAWQISWPMEPQENSVSKTLENGQNASGSVAAAVRHLGV